MAFIIALFIIFFSALQGWRRGLLGMVYRIIAWIFLFIFLAVAQPHIYEYLIRDTSWYQTVYDRALVSIEDRAEDLSKESSLQEWYDDLTTEIPKENTNLLQNFFEDTTLSVEEMGGYQKLLHTSYEGRTLQEMLAEEIADLIIRSAAYVIAFFVAEVIISVGHILVRSIGRVPIIRQVNGFLGIVAGAAEGFLIVWLLMFLLLCLTGTALAGSIGEEIRESQFLLFLYEHNPIQMFFSR